jgi:mRNA interferase MazF
MKAGKTSYVLCHQPKSFDWRVREAAPHPMKRLADASFATVCGVLNQIMQLG